jgi:7-cyano-7-deazaguanine synthase
MTHGPSPDAALVLFSGGQDSATCLAWALTHYARVETIGFDYGQRHAIELQCRQTFLGHIRSRFPQWSPVLGEDHLLHIPVVAEISDTAMTSSQAIEMRANGLPNTFVPGRNLLFFTLAGALAYRRGIAVLVGGMCETDYSGYPDCRRNTLDSLQQALQLGMDYPLKLVTPLMSLDKAQTWRLAQELGGAGLIDLITHETHTCYVGERQQLHAWGYGCAQCPACELRRKGYLAYRQS